MNQTHKLSALLFLSAALAMVISLSSCRKEKFVTDSSAVLEFSVDSILFDTVFTTIGSTTRSFKVYNRNSDRILISSIRLEGGSASPYRINVDGVPGHTHYDVEIAGNDSMYVFVEVTVDPGNQNLPFIVEDEIQFLTNGNDQGVQLAAFGQDAHFYVNEDLTSISPLPCDAVWFNDKPHVIYGVAVVDSACTLTILPGTKVYVHKRGGLWIRKGTLNVQGTLGNEVIFQGDRLEAFYQDQPGQWGIEVGGNTIGGIWMTESRSSVIDYAVIKNGIIGVRVDSLFAQGEPALSLRNTKIQNMSAIGLLASSGCDIDGYNNLISDCGQTCGAFLYGGSYRLDFTTFANYWTDGARQAASFVMSNWYEDVTGTIQIRPITNTRFRNCIMYGSNASLSSFNEFALNMQEDELQDYFFENCLVDTNQPLELPRYSGMVTLNPGFVNPFNGDFHLSNNSAAKDRGTFVGTVTFDLDGNFRTIGFAPDLGCYELP